MDTSTSNSTTKPNYANGHSSEVANTAHDAVDKAAGTVGSAVNSVGSAVNQAAASGHEAIKKVEDKAASAERWLGDKTDAALSAPKNALSDARDYVAAHPLKSLAVAIAAGYLFGLKGRRT